MGETVHTEISPSDLAAIFGRAGSTHGVEVKAEYRQFVYPEYRSTVKGDNIYVFVSDILNCLSRRTMTALAKAIVEKEIHNTDFTGELKNAVIREMKANRDLIRRRLKIDDEYEAKERTLTEIVRHNEILGLCSFDDLDGTELCWCKGTFIGIYNRQLRIICLNELYDEATPLYVQSYIMYCNTCAMLGKDWQHESDKHPNKDRAEKWLKENERFKPDSVYSVPGLKTTKK